MGYYNSSLLEYNNNNNNNTCYLCFVKNSNVRTICIQENIWLYDLICRLHHIFTKINPYSYLLLCDQCLMKLRIFTKCQDLKFIQSMQQDEELHPEHSNCQCDSCQARFGNLPLLAEVIEKIESIPAPEPSTSTGTSATKTNRKEMKCTHCNKIFTHKGDLNKHIRKHTGEQPYKCEICQRRFAHTSNLQRHLRVHSGDKPFRCEKCNKNFSRKDKLVLHQKTKLCLKTSKLST